MEDIKKSFEQLVELKFQLYNGLFLTLPLEAVDQAGPLMPALAEACASGLQQKQTPQQIIDQFFARHNEKLSKRERINFLFRVIQYVERQIVLLDALDEAAYTELHQSEVGNELTSLLRRVKKEEKKPRLAQVLEEFKVRVTLTAHPTQFYTGPVLGVITDLAQAIEAGDAPHIKDLLQQLGHTPFFKQEQPTPYDEAVLLSWYLGNIFYPTMGNILDRIARDFPDFTETNPNLLGVGFWPGGDRDGNPFVRSDTTLAVAARLRRLIVTCYHQDLRRIKRRLSFRGIYERLEVLEHTLYLELSSADLGEEGPMTQSRLVSNLDELCRDLRADYQGLFVEELESLKRRVKAFGFHFASLDIRQDSRVIRAAFDWLIAELGLDLGKDFEQLPEQEQISRLLKIEPKWAERVATLDLSSADPLHEDTFESIALARTIQHRNGFLGCHRYIISNCRSAVDVARVLALQSLCYLRSELGDAADSSPEYLDIVPLFETVEDLASAGLSMEALYSNPLYKGYLSRRAGQQTIMLGFSDGTKDGGYLKANWSIYRAKEDMTAVSRRNDIEVSFFDGRGGPPARGGGHSYEFYAAMGQEIEAKQVQLTVQGQTVSSYYGSSPASLHNLRQLLAAGLENAVYKDPANHLSVPQRDLIDELADTSYACYRDLKKHPLFISYLEEMTTLRFYGQTNIGSRPTKRAGGADSELRLEDLRAIPFVGAWAQSKQNVPGYFGIGTALRTVEEQGRFAECMELYHHSRFFRALITNSMQSMLKSNMELTAYMAEDPVYGEFWHILNDEFELSKRMLLQLTGESVLLESQPGSRLGIDLRQRVVLPLLTIQQYALMQLKKEGADSEVSKLYEKMVVRSLFGNINASRNSA